MSYNCDMQVFVVLVETRPAIFTRVTFSCLRLRWIAVHTGCRVSLFDCLFKDIHFPPSSNHQSSELITGLRKAPPVRRKSEKRCFHDTFTIFLRTDTSTSPHREKTFFFSFQIVSVSITSFYLRYLGFAQLSVRWKLRKHWMK